MRFEQMLPGGESLTAHEASMVVSERTGERFTVTASPLQRALRSLRPPRDYSNVRGPQPRIQRRGPITDFIYFDGGLARVECQHGFVWPEGDWTTEHGGRACGVCVDEWQRAYWGDRW